MKHGLPEAIAFIIATIALVLYFVTDHAPFAVIAIFNTILSTESAILGAIEKTKEGR